ncbi:Short-chain dehydrogenase/reductase SDR [Penicillium taxi]|uniref:Short-chain dehydrogenase/reductase SDR n=1 Tax=Penicillium taxi TaxID=168475 RepID=UPI002545B61D|nr:Short-chain dehydrogenase/reductase SDR [Penicillium taxi]KAJ5909067.1 Short-chain dehydrogenase/reductase SDR [Penicillium taxi]
MGSYAEERVAILIGATSGVGVDIARHLCAQGWIVACTARRQEPGDQLLKTLPKNKAQFFTADVSKYEDSVEVFRKVHERWGRIDAVCVNAGIVDKSSIYRFDWKDKPVEDVPPPPDTSVVETNYKGVIYCTQLATHFMRHNPQPGGRIIITSSIGGMFPHKAYPIYCGTKSAVNQFARGAAPILKQKENILLNVVMPGILDTPIVPPGMIKAVSPECITPISTVLKAFDIFLEDTTGMAGELLECSAEKLLYYPLPEPLNGPITKRATTVWEPLFEMIHGENSELEEALS